LLGLVLACAAPQRPSSTAGPSQVQPSEPPAARDAAPPTPPLESFTVAGASPIEITHFAWSLAVDLGYFRDEGLAPRFVALPSAQMLAALLGRDAQYTLDMTGQVSGLLEARGALPLRLLAVLAAKPQHAVLAQARYQSVPELKGGTLGVKAAGDTGHRAAKLLWQANGLDPVTDMQLLAIGPEQARLAAMQTGTLDAAVFTPPALQMAQALGYRLMGRASDVSNVPQSGIWTLRERLEERPTEVVAVLRAVVRSLQFLHDPAHREVVVAAIGRLLEVEDHEVAEGIYDGARAGLSTDGTVPERTIQELIDLQNAQRDAPVALDLASFTDWGPLRAAQRDLSPTRSPPR
jgi:ABC-type nitrate/sulfonate/bicarbonate transport system substrate-binding protein